MIGIERLRDWVGTLRLSGLVWAEEMADELESTVDQIERESDAEVADSPYDAILPEDREAIAWVREHRGLDHVREEWRRRSNLKRMCEKEKAKVERQQRHIEFVQGKCRERQGHIVAIGKELAELRKVLSDYRDALGGMCERLGITDGTSLPEMPGVICEAFDRRLMPEGVEWPRDESGELVQFGDDVSRHGEDFEANVIALYRDGSFSLNFWAYSKDERVKRPAVLAGDGEPLEVGQTVWDTDAESDTPLTVVEVSSDLIRCEYTWKDGKTYRPCYPPSDLTHSKPEPPDSWERIEEDAKKYFCDYFDYVGKRCDGCPALEVPGRCESAKDADLVRRCRALAERGE